MNIINKLLNAMKQRNIILSRHSSWRVVLKQLSFVDTAPFALGRFIPTTTLAAIVSLIGDV